MCVTYTLRHPLLPWTDPPGSFAGITCALHSLLDGNPFTGSGTQLTWEIRSSSELKRTFSRWFSLSDRKWFSTLHGHCFFLFTYLLWNLLAKPYTKWQNFVPACSGQELQANCLSTIPCCKALWKQALMPDKACCQSLFYFNIPLLNVKDYFL